MISVLIVEDDRHVSNFLTTGVKAEGYNVENCDQGSVAVQKSVLNPSSIMILDRMLPDTDGADVCLKLREQGYTGHILMLTARDTVSDRIDGLKSGADDYLCKPFDFDELLARLEAFKRRDTMSHSSPSPRVVTSGNLQIDLNTNEVFCENKPLDLTKREFELLNFLAINEGKVLSKTEILRGVWGYSGETETKIVEVYIRYLRQKFEKNDCKIEIESIRGFGYRIKA